MSDRVLLEALELEAPIGVYAHEHGVLQKLIVDIIVERDLKRAGSSDDLAHALDYDKLAAIARETATERHHQLIETVAEKIAARILAELAVERVFVRIAKPGAVKNARAAAVEIWRQP